MKGKNVKSRVRASRGVGGLTLLGVWAASAALPHSRTYGEVRSYTVRNGGSVGLTRSTQEWAVTLRGCEQAEACALRAQAAGLGDLVPYDSAGEEINVRMLNVPQTQAHQRELMLRDPSVADVQPVYRFDGVDEPVLATGKAVARLSAPMDAGQRAALWAAYGLTEVRAMPRLHEVYVLQPVDAEEDGVLAAEQLSTDLRVAWANPSLRLPAVARQIIPSDKYYDLQWHLNNTGQTRGTVDADIDAPEAWAFANGAGVLLGMFDDSCDVEHEDLAANYAGFGQDVSFAFFVEGYNDPRPKSSFDAHGTAVMGLAAAAANTLGVRGVAYGAKFTATRGLSSFFVEDTQIASAYTFALERGVDVHINSWGFFGGFPDPPVVVEAIQTAFKEGRDPDGAGPEKPLGMVILFASGNYDSENTKGFDLSSLDEVIGVGASQADDLRASFSNYGRELDLLAPGGGNVDLGVTTADSTDMPGTEDRPEITGYNKGGVGIEPGYPDFPFGADIDPGGRYTGFFGGTSAACPIAAGVAALVVSANPKLSATDVRIVMEHTCDRVQPADAQYDGISNRSFKYGYGRVNAHAAVLAARASIENGGRTWPDAPIGVVLDGANLSWTPGKGSEEFLVVQNDNVFEFVPQDGACYDEGQSGCSGQNIAALPTGTTTLFLGCTNNDCGQSAKQAVEVVRPRVGARIVAIYGRDVQTGRYSFGGQAQIQARVAPAVTIQVSPLEGNSPVLVRFSGNAVGELPIDESRTAWDFDVDQGTVVDATTRTTSHTYTAPAGETVFYVARLTMYDIEGNLGSAQVAIKVIGPPLSGDSGEGSQSTLRILASIPGSPGSDVDTGTSPFNVLLSVDASALTGALQSIAWDLGDGNRATSLVVPHTYVNSTQSDLRIPVTAVVTSVTSGGTTVSESATKFITIHPGSDDVNTGDPDLPGTHTLGEGGRASPCGELGMFPLLFMTVSLMWFRRRTV